MAATVYLIPIALADEGYAALPAYLKEKIEECNVFFAENIRTARRAFRKINNKFDIDSREWHETGSAEDEKITTFINCIKQEKIIGIVSESGCPGIADPGQILVAHAHQAGAMVKPLSGPSSVFLALMASGMNGQQFSFNGYLPINSTERTQKIKELEKKVLQENYTQIFIETPYRNTQLFSALISTCQPHIKLCIAFNLTSEEEWVRTRSIAEWKKENADLPKSPAIFLIGN
ncbi:MAG: SAM-dependent methyltransferase [bacterium]|jgi:16S rRNA (cytidine1402-2'-O)-methyltransferase